MAWCGLEGVDGAGKSTLAEAVREELTARLGSAETIHKGPPERDVLEEYATDVEGRENEHFVFDRWHLGELCYPALYRGQGPYGALGVAGFRWVEKFLQARGAVFYVVDAPYAVVRDRLNQRGDDYLKSHHVKPALERFREAAALSCLALRIDAPMTYGEVPALVRNIVQDAVENFEQHVPLRTFPSYVGPIDPSVLLVGEKRGGRPPFASRACFMPLRNKSGEHLWESLPEPLWREVGAANAYEDDIVDLWKVLGMPRVVALGNQACASLCAAGIMHSRVPHPQYAKRFHVREKALYGELIAEAAVSGTEHLAWPS